MKTAASRLSLFVMFVCNIMALCAADAREWRLVWSEDFEQSEIDEAVWSKIPRGGSDWNRHMAPYDSLYAVNDGILTLYGVNNNDLESDTARFLTGGVWTRAKRQFEPGRIEVKARFESARGAWPAIWLLPADTVKYAWPNGGEIDMMEHLNYDTIVYQTVHSNYTLYQGGADNPPHFATHVVNPAEWNVYGVDILPDALVFHINGVETFRYPRVESIDGQYPYYIPMYLLIDMQIQGGWVGKADPATLPVKMDIDWVRHYLPD